VLTLIKIMNIYVLETIIFLIALLRGPLPAWASLPCLGCIRGG
jgi:hypothetical protein